MNDSQVKERTLSGVSWRLMERVGAQGVTLVVSVILSRILLPAEYDVVTLAWAIAMLLELFVDSGLGEALIQKKDADALDFSTVFWFNIGVSVVMYLILFFIAPLVERIYGYPGFARLLRVLGLLILILGVKNVQQAYVARHFLFKRFFFATLGGTVGAAVLGIWMALHGFGAWALVGQHLFNHTVDTLILWLTVPFRPTAEFSGKRLKELFRFGWKLLASAFLNRGFLEIRKIIIGLYYEAQGTLSFYDKGERFPKIFATNLNTAIDSVLLSTMSESQDDRERVLSMTRRSLRLTTYLIMPVMAGLAVCGEPMVILLLTKKWLPCAAFIALFCGVYALQPIQTANMNAIKALGRSDVYLILDVIRTVISLAVLLVTVRMGILAVAWGVLLCGVLNFFINAYPNKKILGYRYLDQLKDILPQTLCSLAMGAAVYAVTLFDLRPVITLLIQVPLGVVLYLALSLIFRLDSFGYLVDLIRSMLGRSKKEKGN